VCSHPARDRIDALLVAGDRSYPDLAREFAVSDDSIHRHGQTHLPARLLANREALQARADQRFVKLAVTQAENRLARIQRRTDQLEAVVQARAAMADPGVAGDATGLIVKEMRSIRLAKDQWREVVDARLDTGLLQEERALERAAAVETGEFLAQMGRGAFGAGGASGTGPLVVVLSSGLQPIPASGAGPGVARHRINDARRRVSATAAQVEGHVAAGIPLEFIDVEMPPGPPALEDTLQRTLSGVSDRAEDGEDGDGLDSD
jgi:hypothetical protein